MAAQVVGGSFLSAFLQVLFDRMSSREVVDFFNANKVNHQILQKLNATMICVNGVLDDAEEKQNSKPNVKKWLDELKDAVFEADDLLDEIAYKVLESDASSSSSSSSITKLVQVHLFLPSYNPFRKVIERVKLQQILERLDHLVKQMHALGLRELTVGQNPSSHKLPTTSLEDPSGVVYGRANDKEAIIDLLLSDHDILATGNDHLAVIPIVGMGGIGKTTLAQIVYNDNRVQDWFDLKAWVCVSEDFNVFKITKDIYQEVTSLNCDAKTPNQLQVELKEKLNRKKLLLVLDDVWNDKYADWDILQRPLKSLARESKVIVTTRNKNVAMVMRTAPIHYLNELSDDNCWLLFAQHAFEDGNLSSYPDLVPYGKEIARRCKGLPLAAKIIGGLLSSERDAGQWEKISKSSIWDLSNDNILPALKLSYHYLPSHLKQCFAYCAIFPKDYEFEREELVLFWMAEGFLVQPNSNKLMEELGNEYFDYLVSRSFFQPSSNGHQSYFVMHDLINDLAAFVSGEFCFRLEGDHPCRITKRTRHLSYVRTKHDNSLKFEGISRAKFLRTFLPIGLLSGFIEGEVIGNILPALKCLRVLSLSKYDNVISLPDSISNLKHLRYLNLSRTPITVLPEVVSNLYHLQILNLCGCNDLIVLPESVGNLKYLRHLNLRETSIQKLPESCTCLYNLQTLILRGCRELVHLPIDLVKLINLCHLDIREMKLQEMPAQMGKLKRLQILSDYIVGKQSESSIKQLGELQLQGDLCICNLQNVNDARDGLEAGMKYKKHLKKLKLKWEGETRNSQHERDVLEQLQPHVSLEYLSVIGYGSTRFPDWIGELSFSNMVSIKLSECRYCLFLPPLGQLASLRQLVIRGFDGITVVDPQFYGSCSSRTKPFASLKVLRFEKMQQWSRWISDRNEGEEGAFPLLQELYIRECPNLLGNLPSHLPSLTTLMAEECQQLATSLPTSPTILKIKLLDASRDVRLEKLPSGLHRFVVDKLHSASDQEMNQMAGISSTLEEIEVRQHDSVRCIPLELFPKLEVVQVAKCPNLQSLSSHGGIIQKNVVTSLKSLDIKECPNLVSFPKGGLVASNMKYLQLLGCLSLKCLPENMHCLLQSLVSLKLDNCPELESFPDGGLPSRLEQLEICSCSKLIAARRRWNLPVLGSLSRFKLGMYRDVESFPEDTLLPSTLTSLTILNLPSLKSLHSKGLEDLTSLRELTIANCPKLCSLPENGLPSSLFSLVIYNCALLEQRCQHETGEDWSKIAHIPHVEINLPNINT